LLGQLHVFWLAGQLIPVICQPISVRRPFYFEHCQFVYLIQVNFSFLLLYCLKFILNYFFLSYFSLFESAFFHFELALFGFAAAVY